VKKFANVCFFFLKSQIFSFIIAIISHLLTKTLTFLTIQNQFSKSKAT